tara:strand:+ start:416 stop:1000 length:585 start_codon:yes stop_codon:yes gene_type:complete
MHNPQKVLIGKGGHSKEVSISLHSIGIMNIPCLDENEFIERFKDNLFDVEVMVAVGDSNLREQIVSRLPMETQYFSFVHPTACIMDKSIKINDGSFIGPNSILTTQINIGSHVLLLRGNSIGHDCNIGNFLSMMPNSVISGNNNIGDNFYIGTNSSTKEKINICSNVKVGLNSGVVNNLKESGVYGGIPVKKIQ